MFRFPTLVLVAALSLAGMAMPSRSTAADLKVTPSTATASLQAARGGDTVTMAGAYGMLTVPPTKYDPPLIINATGATFAGVRINGVDGVVWRGGSVTAPGGLGTVTAPPRGDAGYAVTVTSSSNVRLEAVTTGAARLGVLIANSKRVTLAGAMITGFGEDGVRATYNEDLTLIGNTITAPALLYKGAHPDAVQAYSNKRLVIAYNTASGAFQGLDDFGGATDPFNDDVLVIGNTVRVFGYFHGLTFTSSTKVSLIGNDVGALPGWARTVTIRAPVGALQCRNAGSVAVVAKKDC